MTDSAKKGIDATIKWLSIIENEKGKIPQSYQLPVDADHSALLNRLLNGKEPLPEPPPLVFSYPCYRMFDNGYFEPFDVNIDFNMDLSDVFGDAELILIDQSVWKVEEKVSDNEFIIKYWIRQSTKDHRWSKINCVLKKENNKWVIRPEIKSDNL